MRYFKRKWDESRGDEYDWWGSSTWYFEVGEDGHPVRQLEHYETGAVLKYDGNHLEDEFGGIGEEPLDLVEFAQFEIDKVAFETMWSSAPAQR